jgi:F-type H+-transporting ATPase subunit b
MLIWQMVLIQIATFVLIVFALRGLLYSHISRALQKLHMLNQQNMAKEKALKEELARAKVQAEGEISRGKAEAEAIKEKLKGESEKEADNLIENARKESKRIIDEALRESQRRVKEAEDLMYEKSAYLAADIIKYIFTQAGQENLQKQLVDELVDELERIPGEKIKIEKACVDVVCAFEIGDKQKQRLSEILKKKTGADISINMRTDENIVAGMILRSGGFVIDGSVSNKLKKALPVFKEKARQEAKSF